MYDVIIIGGGVAGCGVAITLGSSEGTKTGKFETLIIDNGKSDLLKSKLYNIPFLEQGTSGKDALDKLRKDTLAYNSIKFKEDTVLSIEGEDGDFTIKCQNNTFKTKEVVIATGFHSLNITINNETIPTVKHELSPKDGKIKVVYQGRNEIQQGIYVAGLLAGVTTMYSTALGSGVEVASAILSKRAGKVTIIHDFEGSR